MLLIAATAQIMLGLQWYDPSMTLLTHIFIVYASAAWLAVLGLEIRHQRTSRAKFNEEKGSGYMTSIDLVHDLKLFEKTLELIAEMTMLADMHRPTNSKYCLLQTWARSHKDTGLLDKIKMACCGARGMYVRRELSMSTVEALIYLQWLHEHVDGMELEEDHMKKKRDDVKEKAHNLNQMVSRGSPKTSKKKKEIDMELVEMTTTKISPEEFQEKTF